MKRLFAFLPLLFIAMFASSQTPGIKTPKLFAPGVISKGDYESHPAFSPTGDTLYFIKCSYDLKISAICVSYFKGGQWTAPEVASFSGQYMDADPFVTKDGKSIFFMSDRPIKPGDPVRDNTDIWKVMIGGSGWGDPIHLEEPVNSDADEYYPTMTDDGTLYFGSTRDGGKGGSDIYRCRMENGRYLPAENLGDSINTSGNDFEAFIAPDESYLVYNSTTAGLNKLDFFISYHKNGGWTKARKLPAPISSDNIDWSPKVTRDGKTFYFSSTRSNVPVIPTKKQNMQGVDKRLHEPGNGMSDIYTVDFSELIKAGKL